MDLPKSIISIPLRLSLSHLLPLSFYFFFFSFLPFSSLCTLLFFSLHHCNHPTTCKLILKHHRPQRHNTKIDLEPRKPICLRLTFWRWRTKIPKSITRCFRSTKRGCKWHRVERSSSKYGNQSFRYRVIGYYENQSFYKSNQAWVCGSKGD